jgi:hypothetical protein
MLADGTQPHGLIRYEKAIKIIGAGPLTHLTAVRVPHPEPTRSGLAQCRDPNGARRIAAFMAPNGFPIISVAISPLRHAALRLSALRSCPQDRHGLGR